MRNKFFLTLALGVVFTAGTAAADNVGTCGWGSKLFDGQKGLVPQVLAVTTNGTSGNQTFGMTSGTSGCTQNGTVRSSWKTAAFIDNNMNRLALDMSRGEGESLDSLASLTGVDSADKQLFAATLKNNFSKIYTSEEVTSQNVVNSIRNVLATSDALAKYAARV